MYIILILILIMIFGIALLMFNYEIMAPPVALTAMFLLCLLVGLTRYMDWNLSSYSAMAVLLVIAGIVSYIIGGYCAYHAFYKKHRVHRTSILPCSQDRIRVNIIFLLIAIAIGVIELVLFYSFIYSTVLLNGYSHTGITELLLSYRTLSVSSALIDMPRYLSVLKYIVEINAIISFFILIHNFCFSTFKKRDIIYLVIILFWIGNSILTSSRGDFLTILAMGIYLIYFFVNMKRGFLINVEYKIVKIGIELLVIFLAAFIGLAIFMGRRTSFTFDSLVDYLTIYISGGLRAFDLYVQDGVNIRSGIVGNDETFHYISIIASRLFGYDNLKPIHLEFRSINNQNIGNIYTAFRRYYSDFGILGMVILSSISGFLMTGLYSKSRYEASLNIIKPTILIFAWLSRSILYMPIDDYLYLFVFTLNGLFKIVVLCLLFDFIIRKKVNVRYGGKSNLNV